MCSTRGLSLSVEIAIIAVSIAVFLALAFATKAVTGAEALIYYHHEIAVLCAAAGVAALLGAPTSATSTRPRSGSEVPRVWPDRLPVSRLLPRPSGCTRGQLPRCPRGSRISWVPVRGDDPPVQALEAVAAAGLVLAGLVLIPDRPGAAFGFYVSGYAVIRFGLELLRGDPQRLYWHGLSEAQWTSLLVALAITALAAAGLVPGLALHAICAAALVLAIPLAVRRPRELLDPRHVRELAGRLPAPRPGAPRVTTTSLGVQVSVRMTGVMSLPRHALPARPPFARYDETDALARLVQWLTATSCRRDCVPGVAGTVHLVFQAADPRMAESCPRPRAGDRTGIDVSRGRGEGVTVLWPRRW